MKVTFVRRLVPEDPSLWTIELEVAEGATLVSAVPAIRQELRRRNRGEVLDNNDNPRTENGPILWSYRMHGGDVITFLIFET